MLDKIQSYIRQEEKRLDKGDVYDRDSVGYMSDAGFTLEVLYEDNVSCYSISNHLELGYKLNSDQWSQLGHGTQGILPLLYAYCNATE